MGTDRWVGKGEGPTKLQDPGATSSLKHAPCLRKRTFALRRLPLQKSCFLWGLEEKRVSGKDAWSPRFPLG